MALLLKNGKSKIINNVEFKNDPYNIGTATKPCFRCNHYIGNACKFCTICTKNSKKKIPYLSKNEWMNIRKKYLAIKIQ